MECFHNKETDLLEDNREVTTCVNFLETHGSSPVPQNGEWCQIKNISDINALSQAIGWCAPKQGCCKLTLCISKGIIQEALIETIGCSSITHSAAIVSEILPGKNILEALNTDLVCDAINVAMRELFLQVAYGRSQTAFSKNGLPLGSMLNDLGKYIKSDVSTTYSNLESGPRYFETAEGYIKKMALDENNQIIGYEYVNLAKMINLIDQGYGEKEALIKSAKTFGRFSEAVKIVNPREL
jgi:NifU-like protein involved in Fe-S cluster formation